MINLHFVTSNQISAYRKLNLPLTSRTYFVFEPLEMQKKTRTDQGIPRVFLLCLKRNNPQTFKSGSCINPFLQSVCYCYNLLRWMFFILCDNWTTLLFMKVCRYFEIFLSAMLLLSLKPVFCKKYVFLWVIFIITIWCWYESSKIKPNFLNFLIFVTNFTFVYVPYFSLQIKFFFINEIFKLKTSLGAFFYDAILIF